MSNTRTMSHSLQNTTEHKVYKAYNHTQSFSPAGTQCLTSTIHNTQSLCYLPGCFRPQSPTPQAKLCAFSSPFHRTITLQKYHLPEHRACNRTQSFIYHIHRTQSFIYHIHRTQSFIYHIPRLEKITEAYI